MYAHPCTYSVPNREIRYPNTDHTYTIPATIHKRHCDQKRQTVANTQSERDSIVILSVVHMQHPVDKEEEVVEKRQLIRSTYTQDAKRNKEMKRKTTIKQTVGKVETKTIGVQYKNIAHSHTYSYSTIHAVESITRAVTESHQQQQKAQKLLLTLSCSYTFTYTRQPIHTDTH